MWSLKHSPLYPESTLPSTIFLPPPPHTQHTEYALPNSRMHFTHYALPPPQCILDKVDYASVGYTLPTVHFTYYPHSQESVLTKVEYASVGCVLSTVLLYALCSPPPRILGTLYPLVDCTLLTMLYTPHAYWVKQIMLQWTALYPLHFTPPHPPKEIVLSKTDYASVRSTLPTVHFTSPSPSKVD